MKTFFRFACILIGIILGFPNIALSNTQSSNELVEKAVVQFREKNFGNAVRYLEKAVDANPADALLLERCVRLIDTSMQDQSSAISLCSRVIKKLPNNTEAYRLRMICHFKSDDRENASEDLKKIEELEPNKVTTFLTRSQACNFIGSHKEAADSLSKAILLEPENAYFYILRGNAYFACKNYPKARTDFLKALDLNPNCLKEYGFPAGILETNLVKSGYLVKQNSAK